MPSISSLCALILTLLILPIAKWQAIIRKFIRGKLKAIVAAVLATLTIFTAPTTGTNTTIDDNPLTYAYTLQSVTDATIATPATTEAEIATTTVTTAIEHAIIESAAPIVTEATTEPSTEPPHIHSFSLATCTLPKTCVCGDTDGVANGHKFSNGKCTVCGTADPDYKIENLVWIPTNGGKKYHCRSTCSNMDEPIQVTQTEAVALGFTACKKCY